MSQPGEVNADTLVEEPGLAEAPSVEAPEVELYAGLEDTDFDEGLEDVPEPSPVVEKTGAAAGSPAVSTTAVSAPPVAPVAVPVDPSATPAPAQLTPGGTDVPVAPAASQNALLEEQSRQDVLAKREALISEIEKSYALPEAQRDMLLTEPEKVLPAMAARLYVDTYDAVFGAVQGLLPQMIAAVTKTAEVQKQSETAFFTKWPALAKPELKEPLMNLARTYRAANPNASFDQTVQQLGAWAHVALGIPLEGPAPVARPAPSPVGRPHIPVAPGHSGSAPAPTTPGNLWAELSEYED